MAEIMLSITGGTVLIDEQDLELVVSIGKWHVGDMGYAVNRRVENGIKRTLRMHRLINDTPADMVTDHINRDRLDNRRVNLRTVTQQENCLNKMQVENAKYYWLHKQNGNWAVEIGGKSYGSYETEEIAQEIVLLVQAGETITLPVATECLHGHTLDDAYIYGGKKHCRTCQSITAKKYIKRTYVSKPRRVVTVCPRGHDKTITKTKTGDCRECAKIRANERYRRVKS